MKFDSKTKFFQLLKQFKTEYDGELIYNGYSINERGSVEANLISAYDEFKSEFEANLFTDKELTSKYILVLLNSLKSILEEVTFQYEENVLSFRIPLSEEEFPDKDERERANNRLQEQYKANQLPLLEEIVRRQMGIIKNCISYIQDLKSTFEVEINMDISPDSLQTVIEEEGQRPSGDNLCFKLSKNELVTLFHILRTQGQINNKRNNLISFIEKHFCYWNTTEARFKNLTNVSTLINQLFNGQKPLQYSQDELVKILEDSKYKIDQIIKNVQEAKITEEEI